MPRSQIVTYGLRCGWVVLDAVTGLRLAIWRECCAPRGISIPV